MLKASTKTELVREDTIQDGRGEGEFGLLTLYCRNYWEPVQMLLAGRPGSGSLIKIEGANIGFPKEWEQQ